MQLIGKEFPMLLGSVTAPWIGKPYIIGANGEIRKMNVWFTRIHGKVAEDILARGITSLSEASPLINQICMEESSPVPIKFCTQCLKWGNHGAYERGLAGCSVPGHCLYCGSNTSPSLYKQHEEACETSSDSVICQPCTKNGGPNDHHPSNLALCPLARPRLQATLLATQVRQLHYNNRLVADISTRIRIKGGVPEDILSARRDLWQNAIKTDHYLAIMSQLPDMHSIPSTWDVTAGISLNYLPYLTFHNYYLFNIAIQGRSLQHPHRIRPKPRQQLSMTLSPTPNAC